MSSRAALNIAAAIAAALMLVAAACRTVGPNYNRPPAPSASAYKEAPPAGWQTAQPNDAALKGAWWQIFNDAELNTLEPQVVNNNFSLKAAQEHYLEARALIKFYHADKMPTVTVGASITPQRTPVNPIFNSPPETFTQYILPFDVTWEPDIWGKVAREVESQTATTAVAAADIENLRLSLQAELAMDYFQARDLDAEARLLETAVDDYQHALDLTRTRHAGGLVSEVDVAQAETQLESTRAQSVDTQVQRTAFEHAIAVLMGQPPESFSLPVSPLADPPPAIPVGVPGDLLQRRPDIAAAERQMAAANAQIGVAKAAFYPDITLSAAVGLQNTVFGNLYNTPSMFWSVGAAALETITSGGHRNALTEQAQHTYVEQVDNYRQTVLTAFQEVEDNLSTLRVLGQESSTVQNAVAAAQHSLDLSNTRYKGGVTTYLEVITAQNAALQGEQTQVDVLGRRLTASVLLIKALGGGWGTSTLPR